MFFSCLVSLSGREEPGLIPAMVNSVAAYLLISPYSMGCFIRYVFYSLHKFDIYH